MQRKKGFGYIAASVLVAAGILLPASVARAANPAFTRSFGAGEACTFALNVSGTGGNSTLPRHSTDGMIISGGTGSALTFSNPANGKSVSFPSNGAASVTTVNPDGSSVFQITGHN